MRRRIFGAFVLLFCAGVIRCGSNKTTGGGPNAGLDGGAPDGRAPDGSTADSGTSSTVNDSGAFDATTLDAGGNGVNDGGAPGDQFVPPFEAGPPEPDVDAGDSVLRHHKNFNRDGVYVEAALTKVAVLGTAAGASADGGTSGLHQDPGFHGVLPDPNDHVFAQPLFVDGMGAGPDLVIVATAANNVYALDATTGVQQWVENVGTPVPLMSMPCGNLDPFGITGTPVIDFLSRTIFFDAEVLPPVPSDGGDAGILPKHEIFALSIDTGALKAGWPVDVGAVAKSGAVTFNAPFHGHLGALAILAGTLYVPYGALFGDCQPVDSGPMAAYPDPDPTPYHGWIVGVPIANPAGVQAWATPACGGGAWAPGGVSSDRSTLYIATGNTDPACTNQGTVWGGGEGVFRFGTGAAFGAPVDSYAPGNWPLLDEEDNDMGSAPIVFDLANSTPGQLAIVFGKDGDAYLLDRTHLGGIGNALGADGGTGPAPFATLNVAVNEIITAPALYATATATYVSFRANGAFCTGARGDIATVAIMPGSPPTLAGAWCGVGGSGSPMVTTSDGHADAIVWQMGADGDNHLHAFDGDTGAPLAYPGSQVTIPNMRRYNSPIAAKGRIYVAADGAVVAFSL